MGKVIENTNDKFWLDSSNVNVDIPLQSFPVLIQNIIKDYNKYMNYPTEFTAASILAATSVTMGNNIELEFKPRWRETAILYIFLVQERGFAKSHPMDEIFEPIFEKEKVFAAEYEAELKRYKTAIKQDSETEIPFPKKNKITLQKFSMESIYSIHADNPKGILVHNDEAKAWFGSFNQYSKNSDEQFWCNAFNGSHLARETITHGSQYIPKAFISILGGIQPPELLDFIKTNTNNGLMDRILFLYPNYLKTPKWSKEPIPEHVFKNWEAIYKNLYEAFRYLEQTKVIKYSDEAFDKLHEWEANLVDEVNTQNDSIFRGIQRKAETYIHRIAMILEALHMACNGEEKINEVSLNSVNGAIDLVEYFIDEAIKIRNYAKDSIVNKQDIWFTLLPKEFNTQEAENIALKHKLGSRKTVYNWLNKDVRISKLDTGKYKKVA